MIKNGFWLLLAASLLISANNSFGVTIRGKCSPSGSTGVLTDPNHNLFCKGRQSESDCAGGQTWYNCNCSCGGWGTCETLVPFSPVAIPSNKGCKWNKNYFYGNYCDEIPDHGSNSPASQCQAKCNAWGASNCRPKEVECNLPTAQQVAVIGGVAVGSALCGCAIAASGGSLTPIAAPTAAALCGIGYAACCGEGGGSGGPITY